MNWIKEESEKLLSFIETASQAELDAALDAVQFGSLVNESIPSEGYECGQTFKVQASSDAAVEFLAVDYTMHVQSPALETYEEMPLAV